VNTDPIGNVQAFTKLDQRVQFAAQYTTAVMKKALDAQQAEAQQMLALLDPNVGRTVDVRA
jgi:Putative motility protein